MPKLSFLSLDSLHSEVPSEHFEKMASILESLFPKELIFEDPSDFTHWGKKHLPLIQWSECSLFPGSLIVQLLCSKNARLQIESFFPDIIRRWTLPSKEASLLSFCHMYFSLKGVPDKTFFVGEARILIETAHDLHHAITNLKLLSKEIVTALESSQHAAYLLTTRGTLPALRVTSIHRLLNHWIQKFPNHIDEKVLDEMGLLLATASKEFFEQRNIRHICRIVTLTHLFRKSLLHSLMHSPDSRHIQVKLLHTLLSFPFCLKPVLGCLIVINLNEEYERLEEKHILSAVKKWAPEAALVKGSYYCCYHKTEKLKVLYLELEKENGHRFSHSERKRVQQKLKEHLSDHIEKVKSSIFVARNEEDILKNILMLRREIRSTKDLPQAIIAIDEQTSTEIIFHIVLVFITKFDRLRLGKLLEKSPNKYSVFIERTQCVGYLRKNHPIDACVFRLHLPRDPSLLRNDLSLNFYGAREKVVHFLQSAIGEFRDYNGGLILKQTETLSKLKQQFPDTTQTTSDLVENFFYSITPIEKQAVVSFSCLTSLFQLLLESLRLEISKPSDYFLKFEEHNHSTLVILRFQEISLKDHLLPALNSSPYSATNLTTSEFTVKGTKAICYMYEHQDEKNRKKWSSLVRTAVEKWHTHLKSSKTLSSVIPFAPTSLDPRMAGDEFTGNILRLLFEGLTRLDKNGKFEHGMAESVAISTDQREYTFKLRKALWNNKTPVVAYDFEYAWKKILSPDFITPYAYLFYPIKNAKEAKQGTISLDQVGIKTLDDQTLHVKLSFPAPYFLELTAHTIYSPINHQVDRLHPNWPLQNREDYVCNGAFQLKTHFPNQHYELTKNPNYHDAQHVELDKITISKSSYYLANQMFKRGEIDWIGQPFGPWDPIFEDEHTDQLIVSPNQGLQLYVFNTQKFPFHHLKLRQAFALAINRTMISQSLQTATQPAYSFLLPFLRRDSEQKLLDENLEHARQLFREALQELNLTLGSFPTISLLYAQGGIRDHSALLMKQQWENAFHIQCRLEPLDWSLVFHKMKQGDFHISGTLWRFIINDPIYILNFVRYPGESINFPKWENAEYQRLLNLADYELDLNKRSYFLMKAEEVLAKEVPLIPVFYTDFKALIKKHIMHPILSPIGVLDIKWTQFKKQKKTR